MQSRTEQERQAHIRAIWLLFLSTPTHQKPDIDGMFDLGEIGEAAPNQFSRMTPYSIARPKHEAKETYAITIRR